MVRSTHLIVCILLALTACRRPEDEVASETTAHIAGRRAWVNLQACLFGAPLHGDYVEAMTARLRGRYAHSGWPGYCRRWSEALAWEADRLGDQALSEAAFAYGAGLQHDVNIWGSHEEQVPHLERWNIVQANASTLFPGNAFVADADVPPAPSAIAPLVEHAAPLPRDWAWPDGARLSATFTDVSPKAAGARQAVILARQDGFTSALAADIDGELVVGWQGTGRAIHLLRGARSVLESYATIPLTLLAFPPCTSATCEQARIELGRDGTDALVVVTIDGSATAIRVTRDGIARSSAL